MGRISGPLEHMQTPYVPYPLWEGRGNCFPWVFSARSGLPRPGYPLPHTEAPRDGSSSNTVPSPSPPPPRFSPTLRFSAAPCRSFRCRAPQAGLSPGRLGPKWAEQGS